mmetsp:Transcript_2676/g.6402  ORF Transcript_2676/g.6402 Transcript_2676/m.6402 type:complete len:516 (+) Transcript_2676:910-2457(+)
MGERQLLCSRHDIVSCLNPEHTTVVLVCNLVLPRPKPAAAPDVVLLQPRQDFVQHGIPPYRWRWIAVEQTPVVNRHNFAVLCHELGVDSALDCVTHHPRPNSSSAADVHFVLLDFLLFALAHFEHQRPPRPLPVSLQTVGRRRAIAHAQGGQFLFAIGAIGFSVVGENGAAVKWAVALWEIEPALCAVRTLSPDADPDDVRRRVEQTVYRVDRELRPARHGAHDVERKCGDEGLVPDPPAALGGGDLGILIDSRDLVSLAVLLLLPGQEVRNGLPDRTRATLLREPEHGVGSPVPFLLVQKNVRYRLGDIDSSHALPEPRALHVRGGDGPNLVVVRAHEDVGDAISHHAQDPLIEVLRFVLGGRHAHLGLDQAFEACDLVFHGEGTDVVLEGVRNPSVLDPDVRDALKRVPAVVSIANGRVDELVEVLVVAEDDVASHVKEKALGRNIGAGQPTGLVELIDQQPVIVAQLVQPRRCTQARWPSSDHKHAHLFDAARGRHGAPPRPLPSRRPSPRV